MGAQIALEILSLQENICDYSIIESALIEKMLSNEKYIGISVVNVRGKEGQINKLNNSHLSIIPKEMFDTVQEEKLKRSNMVTDENGTHRSGTKYSSKKWGDFASCC